VPCESRDFDNIKASFNKGFTLSVDKTSCERIHLNFCKYTLGAKKTSSNIGVRAELGRFPMEHFIMTQTILYLTRLHTDNVNPLLKEALILSKSLDSPFYQ
jgi:hypothetical protein